MSTWLVPEGELTLDQTRAVRMAPGEHRVIFGAPGSGKTLVLLHRAKFLIRSLHVAPVRFHIFVFTKVLKAYIQSALDLLDIPDQSISNFDSWCYRFYRDHIGRSIPRNDEEGVPDFHEMRRRVLAWLEEHRTEKKLFDFVLVDEGQDLDAETFGILTHIAWHVTVCMDPKQQIFEGGASEKEVLRTLGLKKRNMSLLEAYRCTPYIVQVASRFIEDEEDRLAYQRQVKVDQVEQETPLLYVAADAEDEKRRLAELVRMRQVKGETLAILLRHREQVNRLSEYLGRAGLEVEVPAQRDRGTRRASLNFRSDLPKMMPFHSAKGLTFDSVFMPSLGTDSFEDLPEEQIRRLLFVGATRAIKWLFFSSIRREGLPLAALFDELGRAGHITIHDAGNIKAPAARPPQPPPSPGKGGISDWF